MTDLDRRRFIRAITGAGVVLASSRGGHGNTGAAPGGARPGTDPSIPRRPFGKTGVSVSKLCLGASSVVGTDGRALLDEALRYGIDCWEHSPFAGRTFGDYFEAHPGVRERVFLSAKTRSTSPATMQDDLERALAENETATIDFFAVHGVDDVAVLTDGVRRWAERAKAEGKIRFFGFCTHKRMDRCLEDAAELGWIDGVQAFYSFRMQAAGTMERALRKCLEKGVGIITVKSMGLCVTRGADLRMVRVPERQLRGLLAEHGLSLEQAKLKAVWQNPSLTSVCSWMPTTSIVQANAAAAIDDRPLDRRVTTLLQEYAEATGRYFCRRCGACDTASPQGIPIFQVMESLLYARGYGSRELATRIYSQISADARSKLAQGDYSTAESVCPQHMPIGQLMREAYLELRGFDRGLGR